MYTCRSCGAPNPDPTFERQRCVDCGIGYRKGRPLNPVNLNDHTADCDCDALVEENQQLKRAYDDQMARIISLMAQNTRLRMENERQAGLLKQWEEAES